MSFFKIRNNRTGLFSKGGAPPFFEKNGKTWNTKGALNGHLALVESSRCMMFYKDCSVIEYREVELSSVSVSIHLEAREEEAKVKKERKAALLELRKLRFQKEKEAEELKNLKDRELRELARLKAKYEG